MSESSAEKPAMSESSAEKPAGQWEYITDAEFLRLQHEEDARRAAAAAELCRRCADRHAAELCRQAMQAASAAKPDRSNADKNDDNATAARLLPREEDTQGAPSSAAQPAASSKEKPTEEQKTPSASADPIWSTSPQPTDAMQKWYNRAKKIARRGTGNPLHL